LNSIYVDLEILHLNSAGVVDNTLFFGVLGLYFL
jgi:hypothetical protein